MKGARVGVLSIIGKKAFEELLRINGRYKLLDISLLVSSTGAYIAVVSFSVFTTANYFNTIY